MSEQTDRLEHTQVGSRYYLLDNKEQVLGGVTIRGIDDQAVTADFQAAPALSPVRKLFAEHDEAIERMTMAKVEDLEQKIEKMGLHLETTDHKPGPLIYDVTIRESENSIFFKLRGGYPGEFSQLKG